jgi:hypothetical protein
MPRAWGARLNLSAGLAAEKSRRNRTGTHVNKHKCRVLAPLGTTLLRLQAKRAIPTHGISNIQEILVRHGECGAEYVFFLVEEMIDEVLHKEREP